MCDVKEQKGKTKRNAYHKKYRKRVLIPVIIFLAAAIAVGGSILYVNNHRAQVTAHKYEEEPVRVYMRGDEQVIAYMYEDEQGTVIKYEEDYPEIYAEELRIIFGEDCEIGEKNTIFVDGEDCDCGSSSSSYQYDEWEVTYHDWRGETFTQTIDNEHSLTRLQYSWLTNHLNQYYERRYLFDYFDEGTFEEPTIRTYCSASIGVWGSPFIPDKTEEYDRISEGGRKYKEQLWETYKNRDTMLCLSELNCEEIYNLYPITTSLHLSIDDRELSGEEKAVHEKAVQDKILEMIQAIQRETDDTCNLKVQVVSANGYEDLYDGKKSWRYYILQGKQFEPEGEPNISYAFAHAYAYEGIYW